MEAARCSAERGRWGAERRRRNASAEVRGRKEELTRRNERRQQEVTLTHALWHAALLRVSTAPEDEQKPRPVDQHPAACRGDREQALTSSADPSVSNSVAQLPWRESYGNPVRQSKAATDPCAADACAHACVVVRLVLSPSVPFPCGGRSRCHSGAALHRERERSGGVGRASSEQPCLTCAIICASLFRCTVHPMLARALQSCIRRSSQRSRVRLCAHRATDAFPSVHTAATAQTNRTDCSTLRRATHTQRTTMAEMRSNHADAAAAQTSASASSPLPRTLEIEKKVLLHADTDRILHDLGFRSVGSPVRIVDVYVDDGEATLTRRNFWLRRRDQGWELKMPASSDGVGMASQNGGMTRYEEITDDAAITAALEDLFQRSERLRLELTPEETAELSTPVAAFHITAADESGWPKLMALIRRRACIPITHLSTTRRTLQWEADAAASSASQLASSDPHPYSRLTVVIDAAEYLYDPPASTTNPAAVVSSDALGTYSVAEVEIVLTDPSEAEMKEAEQQVEVFAQQIEAPKQPPSAATTSALYPLPKGKIERYLALFRPAHYRLLTSRRQ